MPRARAADILDVGRASSLQTMGEPVDMPVPAAEAPRLAHPPVFASLNNPRFVSFLFAGLVALQAVGYLILGTGRAGRDLSETLLCFHNLLALNCVWITFRRARGAAALFWFLFGVNLFFLMVPTVLMTVSTLLNINLVSLSTWRVLFCLYGAPIFIMLFLPETDQRGRQT